VTWRQSPYTMCAALAPGRLMTESAPSLTVQVDRPLLKDNAPCYHTFSKNWALTRNHYLSTFPKSSLHPTIEWGSFAFSLVWDKTYLPCKGSLRETSAPPPELGYKKWTFQTQDKTKMKKLEPMKLRWHTAAVMLCSVWQLKWREQALFLQLPSILRL
jgi:hypothetical protein